MLLAATPYLRIMSPPLVAYSSALFSSSSCCVTSSLSTTARRHDWRRIMIRNNNIFNNKNWWRDGVVKCNSSGSRRVFGQSKKKKEKKNKDPPNNINTNTNSAPGLSLSSPPGSDKSPNKLRTNNTTDFQFEQRLQAIKRSALEQKKLDQQTAQYGAIDYDQTNTTNKDPPPKTIGLPAKIGIGVAVVIFGLVFALGDFLPTTPTGPSNEAAVVDSQLSEEERKTLQARLEQFEATLTANPKDPMAVEGAAVTLAELGEYSRAASLLEDLTKMKPNDPDAFRLLGEVQYQLKDYKGSAASYKRSAMVSKTANFEVLRGLTNALLADKKPDEAVQVLLVFRERLNTEKMAQGSSQKAESDVADPTVQVELLLGKAYSDWGHVSDAVSVYDRLISTHPDDFRGYLAKGIILKENGRAGDAERMFIQARFFAPEKAKALVDRYSRR